LLTLLLPLLAAMKFIALMFSRLIAFYHCYFSIESKKAFKHTVDCRELSRSCASFASLLSTNAIIASSVMQLPLFAAARRSHSLLRCHASQLVIVAAAAGVVMSCGRFCVALLTAIASITFFYFRTVYHHALPSWVIANTTQGFPFAIIVTSAVIGYIVAAAVFKALSITVDTLFLCLCDEMDSPREREVPHGISALLELHQNAASKAAGTKSPAASASSPGSCKDV
jgi:hypothetical protein